MSVAREFLQLIIILGSDTLAVLYIYSPPTSDSSNIWRGTVIGSKVT